ncbi:hypothetical protein AMTRI_Chr10g233460 [Amborella trichopoda]
MTLLSLRKTIVNGGFHCAGSAIKRRLFCSKTSLFSETTVLSFGDGSHGALGLPFGYGADGYEPTPVAGLPEREVCYVGCGHYHSLALTCDGEVWSWGRNDEGQLGRGLSAPRDSWNQPKKVEGLDHVKARAAFASGVVSTVIGDDGSLWVWGKSKRGQLGLGRGVTEASRPTQIEALSRVEIVKVALGWGHTFALAKDGRVFGWGYSADGRLGQVGDMEPSSLPSFTSPVVRNVTEDTSSLLQVAEKLVSDDMEKEKDMPIIWEPSLLPDLIGVDVADIACGFDHSLILSRNGSLLSCGNNTYGQLSRTSGESSLGPVDIKEHQIIGISAGLGHSLALCRQSLESGYEIFSWGWNQNYQLGRSGVNDLPLKVVGLEGEDIVSVCGGRVHSLALSSMKEVWAWGCGKNGRLGLGSSRDVAEPSLVECLQDVEVIQISSGLDHSLVLVAGHS